MPAAPWTSGSTQGRELGPVPGEGGLGLGEHGRLDRRVGLVGRGDAHGVEEQRPVDLVEEVDATDAHAADRVAVVGLVEGGEAHPARGAGLLVVLEGDLERDLHVEVLPESL